MKAFIELYKNDRFVMRYTQGIMECIEKGQKASAKMYYKNLNGALTYIAWHTEKITYDEAYEFQNAMDRWIESKTGEKHFSWDC